MLGYVLYLVAFLAWLNAIIFDASNNIIGWLLVDILIPPIGVIRGLILLF